MVKVILDTNVLLMPSEFGIDIFAEIARLMKKSYQLCIIDKTLDELEKIIGTGKTKQKLAAKVAKKLLNTYPVKVIKTDKKLHVDRLILKNLEKDTIVATQDSELRRMLRARGVVHIVMHSKSHLELIGV